MSINSAMLAGVSGLIANSSALAAISDNIANVNTVGYKRSSANFSTLVTSQSKNGSLQRRRREGQDPPVHQPAGPDPVDDLEPGPVDLRLRLLRRPPRSRKA
jgi:flagellar basal body rod protein FlgG